MDNQTLVARDDSALFTRLGDNVVMMSLTHGDYYELDEIGSAIWDRIETPQNFATLCASLVAEYAVPEQQCRADVEEFLAGLHAVDMVVLTDGKQP